MLFPKSAKCTQTIIDSKNLKPLVNVHSCSVCLSIAVDVVQLYSHILKDNKLRSYQRRKHSTLGDKVETIELIFDEKSVTESRLPCGTLIS